ncbi:N-terminal domain of peptidoglycan hydrolase CwlO-containing protein [Evansella caseinilytica]|uniref:N-terminal domain of peptidoglycan hydrolase CwlO-containing protein n=1 Tax=Evansella caseinilytica TaxID=1503961 RepID=A0A1H3URS7_9BACI|nr:C40 family peptidase [Evansella caseinilytica]SDZ64479.1 N-terminal domain of peptidoglycan hydrolase CwlO-containing protein [Evansella caseinilytica]
MKKKLVVLNTVIVLGFGSVINVPAALAETTNDLQNQQTQIQEERSEIKSNLSEAEAKIAEVLDELDQLAEQIERVNEAIEDNKKIIAETEENIDDANAEIEQLQEEIAQLEKEIEERTELLKDRAVTYQKNGTSVRYLEVILGSQDFGDFVDRVLAINKIAEADADFLQMHEESKQELEVKQATVEEKLEELNDMKAELDDMQHHLLNQQEQNDELKKQLKAKEKETKTLMAELVEKDEELASQEADIKRKIDEERQRQAEERRAAENASSASSQTTTASTSNSSSGSSQTLSSRSSNSAPAASGDIQTVISAGNKYIGNSVYVFGGGRSDYDIQNGRFDCSGFVRWAFLQIGVNVGGSTDAQKFAGRQVSSSEMRPGDLVFFNTYKTDGHVGIYIGGGQFIGSQSSTGVAIASLNSGYWASVFNGRVVRVVE